MKTTKRLTAVITGLALLCLAAAGQVQAGGFDPGVTVEIVSDYRGALPKYAAGPGDGYARRSYVAAEDDERYRIRVHNRGSERIGVVIAVDGRNIISGSKSHLNPNERMYILGPYQTGEYAGWRTDRNRVNRFYFTGMDDSYAAAWGDYTAMGVIAVAAYRDRHQDVYQPRKFGRDNSPLDRPSARSWGKEPGTGFGEGEWSPSREVEFEPEARPVAREFIKYEWLSTLCKRGIIRCRDQRERGRENRFWPDDHRDRGYAPFPPWWPFR